MSTGLTDIDIISAVLNGNQQAYAQLVERYQGFVFTLVLRYVKSREDAEEVAQDIFVLPTDELIALARSHLTHSLTTEECQQ